MDNDTVAQDFSNLQSENSDEVHPKRKVGVEIVCSAELSSRFFRGWRAASYSLHSTDDLWSRRLAEAMRR